MNNKITFKELFVLFRFRIHLVIAQKKNIVKSNEENKF
jgi:hypothetical protein